MPTTTVKVRFAPSPTGALHLGGARTALFNWLFARNQGGNFFLRIEDTDQERSRENFVRQICDSLEWLGLKWDGPIFYQSQRTDVYRAKIKELLDSGAAYRCFCTPAVLEAQRKAGQYAYPGTCRHLTPDQLKAHLNQGQSYVIRLKIPEGETTFQDQIYGKITVKHQELDDFVIARSDGSPTYNLVVVIDDHDMGITHVIRGDDHLSNTPKQLQIYRALGYSPPEFAHLPMILGPDKRRLSKRHNAPGIEEFRQQGYLPEALLNYLALLGWNPGTDEELFSLQDLVTRFDLTQVQKKGAVYDEKKLHWISGQHIKRQPTDFLFQQIRALSPDWGKGHEIPYLFSVIELLKERAKTIPEFTLQSDYFFHTPDVYEEKAARKHWGSDEVNHWLEEYLKTLTAVPIWNQNTLETALRELAERLKISPGKLIHPVRLALTGVSRGPSLFDIMTLLGRDSCLERLEKAMERLPLTKEESE
jgi:glutamyl-tRNA synthetase